MKVKTFMKVETFREVFCQCRKKLAVDSDSKLQEHSGFIVS